VTGPAVETSSAQLANSVRAGFIGLGHQGLPMARRIAAAGMPVTVWARRPAVAAGAAAWGAEIAASPAELGTACDAVAVCVFDADGVEQVLFGPRGVAAGMPAGGIVIVHSTVSPAEIQAIARRAEPFGITVLDAPVSGGPAAAAAGELLVMLAGPAAAADRALPVVKAYAGRVIRLGEVGTAQLAKLLNNALLAAQVALAHDALSLGARHGLGDGLLDVLRTGSARGFALDLFAQMGSVDALASSQFGPTIGKDVRLLADTLGPVGQPSALLTLAEDLTAQITAIRSSLERDPETAVRPAAKE
jgi:3-hydroxyisobutyrate dehydrogenase-like beta-hydroxyacid dehydrogenase